MAESKRGTVRDWGVRPTKTLPIAEAARGNHMVDAARMGGARASEGDGGAHRRGLGGLSRHV